MFRSCFLLTLTALLACSWPAHAAMSPAGTFIQTRPYHTLSTGDPIGAVSAGEIEKASGIVPSIGDGLVAWADGRGGKTTIVGYVLAQPATGEFLISDETDEWQENNPFVGLGPNTETLQVVYDAARVSVPGGDLGDIEGYDVMTATNSWLIQTAGLQRSPVNTITTSSTYVLAWVDHPGTQSQFPGRLNTDIYVSTVPPASTNITAGMPAPRKSLSADGDYLVWQELVMHDPIAETSSWDIAVHNLVATTFSYVDGPVAGRNQITPDISGDLLVWTQEEDPSGTMATNIYFMDLNAAVGPIAVTTHGAAANAAISRTSFKVMVSPEVFTWIDTAFVVWQDHHLDNSTSFYAGGNGETDFNWDIWAQELRVDGGTGEWALYKDAFLIRSDAGRQTHPDIDGLDVVWQSQAPNVEDIFVWGPAIPEPGTMLLLACGAGALLRMRRGARRAR